MKMKGGKQTWTAIAIAAAFLIVSLYAYQCSWNKVCGAGRIERIVRNEKEILLPNGTIRAEVVDTPSSREQGLSGRSGLKDDEGMLFVFDHSGKYGFWMKDMKFPIDMIWISENGTVMHIERNVSPESYREDPPQTYINQADALYVLELAAGRAEKFGVYLGTKLKIGE